VSCKDIPSSFIFPYFTNLWVCQQVGGQSDFIFA
jgi:hypothetical protein